jgi:hypothetical protein
MIDAANDNIELDITRARTLLDWKPQHSLRDTLPKMVSGLKADHFVWYRENELDLPLWLKELMPTTSKTDKEEMKPHELMQLAEQVRKEIEGTAAPMPPSSSGSEKPKKRHLDEMMDMQQGSGEAA